VPNEARTDAGYIFSRAQWSRRNDRIGEAAQLMLSAPNDPAVALDTNEWWTERRLIARKLLDADNPQAAYRVARDAAIPTKENSRVEHQFTAGWIALRFLNDPITAQRHFAQIATGTNNPISLARGAYWHGRAAEAAGRTHEARQLYEAAARYPTAYYGQLARTKLGRTDIAVRRPPDMGDAQRAALRNVDVVRAVELLYAVGERDLVIPFVADLADKASDIGALVVIAEITARNGDARATLHIGKAAQARGFTFDQYAFPGIGIPKYAALSQTADRSVVYAIARQESMFNASAVSSAKAMGLMQVTPGTGRLIAKKNGVGFDQRRLLSDPGYNAQMGAAELGDLIQAYDGNYILVFVGYNAGRGRVKEWVARYGDPRDPGVDPIDWVERIPFSETRNYVQRVMENMQVYRARFGSDAGLTIEADLRGRRGQ
jgi:peptidoglycan lytic transglycosylase